MKDDQNVNDDFGGEKDERSFPTADSKLKAAAEQADIVEKTSANMKKLEADFEKVKADLKASQAKVKDLMEAVRYRDRKIAKLGLEEDVSIVSSKTVGSNVTDHSHLGEAVDTSGATEGAKDGPKKVSKKASAAKKTSSSKR